MNFILSKIKKVIKKKKLLAIISSENNTSPLLNKERLMTLMDGHPYIHDDEIILLATMTKKNIGPIVEIGCAFGASSSIFLLYGKEGVKLHSIDPFVRDSMGAFHANENLCRKNVLGTLKAFKKEKKYADWNLHTDHSYNIVKNWKETVETIFIDGDHNYDAVKKDFEDWFPFVKKDGYILLHDSRKEEGTPADTFNRGWAGPTKFVNELINSDRVVLVNEVFSVTVWQKR